MYQNQNFQDQYLYGAQGSNQQFDDFEEEALYGINSQNINLSNQRLANYNNYRMNPQYNRGLQMNYNMSRVNPMMNQMENQCTNLQPFYMPSPTQAQQMNVNGYPSQYMEQNSYFSQTSQNQLFLQQFRMTVNMIKGQNQALIQKLRKQNQRIIREFKHIKNLVISGSLRIVKKAANQNETGDQVNQNFQQITTRNESKNSADLKAQRNADALKNKVLSYINAKKDQQNKIKLESEERTGEVFSQLQTLENLTKDLPDQHQHIKFNDELFDARGQYFQLSQNVDFSQQIENFNIDKSYPFSKRIVEFSTYPGKTSSPSFKPKLSPKEEEQYQKQISMICSFLDGYLCQKLEYASKKQFNNFKINKNQVFDVYSKWRKNQVSRLKVNPQVDKRLVLVKLINQLRKRFASCAFDKNFLYGIKFKDENFQKKSLSEN